MATYLVTDLTFTVIKSRRLGGTRGYKEVYGTIFIPASAGGRTYVTGGVPISGVTSTVTGAVVTANALACPGLGFPNELVNLVPLASGLPAGLDDAYTVLFDSAIQADGTAPTRAHNLRLMCPPIAIGAVAAPTFTGSALAVHGHALHLNNADVSDTANARVNAGTNLLGCNTGTDIAVASVADTTGAGGIVQLSAGTPAGTNSAPAFTGTAATSLNSRLVEHITAALNENLTVYVLATGW